MKSLFSLRASAWSVWIIASIFYAYQYILRVMPSIMLDDIMARFHINAATFGQFSGVYYIGYSLMHLPVGIMLDRFGPRKIMTACILLTLIGLLPLIFADYWIYPVLGRLLIGIGSSAAILGVFKVIRLSFSENRFSRMLSFSVTIGLIGAVYGGGPVSYLRNVFGYQSVIYMLLILGFCLALLTYWIIPNMKGKAVHSVTFDIKEVFRNKKVLITCLSAGLMVGPIEGFADVWGSAFLKDSYALSITTSSSLLSLIFIGMGFGGPLLSLLAEKIGSYFAAIIGAGSVMAISFFILLNLHIPQSLLAAIFILIGICCAYQILAIYKAASFVREEVAGLTTAVANMIIMLFGYAFHTVIGSIVNSMGGPSSPKAIFYALLSIPIALSLGTAGFILLSFQNEKRKA